MAKELPLPLPLIIVLAIGGLSIVMFLLLNVWSMWKLVLPNTPWIAGLWPITHYLTTVYLIKRIIGFKSTVTDDEPWMIGCLFINVCSQFFELAGKQTPHVLLFCFIPTLLIMCYVNHTDSYCSPA